MARAIDITYQLLVKKGYLPEFIYFYVVLYSSMSISGYAYGTEPGSMSPWMNKFYLTFTNETLSDMQRGKFGSKEKISIWFSLAFRDKIHLNLCLNLGNIINNLLKERNDGICIFLLS